MEGHEEAGPVAHVPFDCDHVIGLQPHQLLSFVQVVLEVPSTPTVNPNIIPTRITFRKSRSPCTYTFSEVLSIMLSVSMTTLLLHSCPRAVAQILAITLIFTALLNTHQKKVR